MKNYSRKEDELWKNLFNFVVRIEQLMQISYESIRISNHCCKHGWSIL